MHLLSPQFKTARRAIAARRERMVANRFSKIRFRPIRRLEMPVQSEPRALHVNYLVRLILRNRRRIGTIENSRTRIALDFMQRE